MHLRFLILKKYKAINNNYFQMELYDAYDLAQCFIWSQ